VLCNVGFVVCYVNSWSIRVKADTKFTIKNIKYISKQQMFLYDLKRVQPGHVKTKKQQAMEAVGV
jgi:hypothetical protein